VNGGINTSSGYQVDAATGYLQSYNLTLERAIGSAALELAYSGSKGTHLGHKNDVNLPRQSEATYGAGTDLALLRPYPLLQRHYQHVPVRLEFDLQCRPDKAATAARSVNDHAVWIDRHLFDVSDHIQTVAQRAGGLRVLVRSRNVGATVIQPAARKRDILFGPRDFSFSYSTSKVSNPP
jgi:hypothetical protein